jgi:hypothetical protein
LAFESPKVLTFTLFGFIDSFLYFLGFIPGGNLGNGLGLALGAPAPGIIGGAPAPGIMGVEGAPPIGGILGATFPLGNFFLGCNDIISSFLLLDFNFYIWRNGNLLASPFIFFSIDFLECQSIKR